MPQFSPDTKFLLEQAIDKYPLLIHPNTLVVEAIASISQARVSYALIVDHQKLLGILTERDIVKMAAAEMSLAEVAISQVMTQQLVTLPLTEARDIFSVLTLLRSSRIRHLPIMDEQGSVFGVITPESLRAVLKPTDLLQMQRVVDIMATVVTTSPTTASVFEVAQQMSSNRKSCVVICQPLEAGKALSDAPKLPQKPMGIITERDIVKFTSAGLDLVHTLAADVMSCPLLPAPLNFSLWQANHMMQQHGIRRLVVVNDSGYLAGIVTQSTLLQALNPVEMCATVELLQQTITEKTQELRQANERMQQEVMQRQHTENALRQTQENLAEQVKMRTLELTQANAQLSQEIQERIEAEAEVRRLNIVLEQRVQERTSQLEASNQELQQTLEYLQATQQELIQSEKLAALGQLVAGIAHEINTPLGAISASISNISNSLEKSIRQLPELFERLTPKQQADFFSLLEATQQNYEPLSFKEERQLKRNLKKELAAQGIEDASTLASNLINMGFTQDTTFLMPLLQSPNYSLILESVYNFFIQHNNIQNIIMAVERSSKIVWALKSYVHHDSSGHKTKANVIEGIDVVLTIYHNLLKQGVEIIKHYGDVPDILCYPEELNQVWTNLIHNAIQAMQNKGKLIIIVSQENQHIMVQVTDSGCGIPPEIQFRIFEPFFTTKPVGEGSGLGLDIVRKIIEKHQGTIEVKSQPGKTTFTVKLPIL